MEINILKNYIENTLRIDDINVNWIYDIYQINKDGILLNNNNVIYITPFITSIQYFKPNDKLYFIYKLSTCFVGDNFDEFFNIIKANISLNNINCEINIYIYYNYILTQLYAKLITSTYNISSNTLTNIITYLNPLTNMRNVELFYINIKSYYFMIKQRNNTPEQEIIILIEEKICNMLQCRYIYSDYNCILLNFIKNVCNSDIIKVNISNITNIFNQILQQGYHSGNNSGLDYNINYVLFIVIDKIINNISNKPNNQQYIVLNTSLFNTFNDFVINHKRIQKFYDMVCIEGNENYIYNMNYIINNLISGFLYNKDKIQNYLPVIKIILNNFQYNNVQLTSSLKQFNEIIENYNTYNLDINTLNIFNNTIHPLYVRIFNTHIIQNNNINTHLKYIACLKDLINLYNCIIDRKITEYLDEIEHINEIVEDTIDLT